MKRNSVRMLIVALVFILGVSVAVSHPQTSSTAKQSASSAASSLLDINSATKDQLDALPGIGAGLLSEDYRWPPLRQKDRPGK